MYIPRSLRFSFSALVASTLLFASGCSSRRRIEDLEFPDPKQVSRPAMLGEDSFFENNILVEVSLGRGFRPRSKRGMETSRRQNPENSFVQTITIDAGTDAEDLDDDQYFIPRMRNSTLPPVALRLRVTNQGTTPAEIEFVECRSYLGNFAVRPISIVVPAGESGQPDAMTSLLGVPSDEIPVTITLRVGGKAQTKTIPMRVVKRTATPAPASTPSPSK